MQFFAVIPAAGRSERMGQPKLLLPWGDATIIQHVLGVWRASRATHVIVVVHPDDRRLAELIIASGAHLVQPATPPAEMKVSVRLGLAFASRFHPRPDDAWLLAPADMPGLTSATIDRLIHEYEKWADGQGAGAADRAPRIWVPRCGGRRGHPVLFPWSIAGEVALLAADQGLNALLSRHEVEYVESTEDAILEDLDTPDDYRRLLARHGL